MIGFIHPTSCIFRPPKTTILRADDKQCSLEDESAYEKFMCSLIVAASVSAWINRRLLVEGCLISSCESDGRVVRNVSMSRLIDWNAAVYEWNSRVCMSAQRKINLEKMKIGQDDVLGVHWPASWADL